jgi:hypothetical protein
MEWAIGMAIIIGFLEYGFYYDRDNGWKDVIIIIGLMYLATLVTMGVIEIVYQINMYLIRKRIAWWRVENPEKIRILQYVLQHVPS